jgi:hypothetical protein
MVKNGSETDVDCGGSCPNTCGVGLGCGTDFDCATGVCTAGKCAAATCTDFVTNGAETDIDCGGGTCPKCFVGDKCKVGSDCLSNTCTSGVCAAATCKDGVKNGSETDTDCGGTTCSKCGAGKICAINADCTANRCTSVGSGAPTCVGACPNATKDGAETDVDCGGGSCALCALGKSCSTGSDCASGACVAGVCRPKDCRSLKEADKTAASGVYTVSPDGSSALSVYCDMTTDGGGWTLVSINGVVTASGTCTHRIASSAPACGTTPSLTSDWQLAGASQNLFSFQEILVGAYTTPGTLVAATKLTLAAKAKAGTGAFTVTPNALLGAPVSCADTETTFTARTKVGVDPNGFTVWGEPDSTCTSSAGVAANLGLNVPQQDGYHFDPGFDTNDDLSCGCLGSYTPSDLGTRRGFFALR